MRILALVTARAGSKRLPGKNIRPLGGKPLIVWSIDIAKNIPEICDILVSTDCPDIAEVSQKAGAYVPWLRPAELATDTTSSVDVALHALDWYEAEKGAVDGLLLLQPTCPFRREASLCSAVKLFLNQTGGDDRPTVVSVNPSSVPPEWCFRIDATNGALQPVLGWSELGKRSQDLQPAVQLNGSIYIASSATIRAGRPLVGPGSIAFLMSGSEEGIDIDTEDDWRRAEYFLPR
jgi:CMP-N,N'-diacetyllegionaminic acid synthase